MKSDSIVNLIAALIKAKSKFAPIIRERENPGFRRGNQVSRYEDLAAVIDATEPSLLENGLVILQFPQSDGDRVGVLTIIAHESGEYWGDSFTLPLANQNAQTGVAAVTYARRTGLKGVLGVAAEDDDGNTAAGTNTNSTVGNTTPARPANSSTKAAQPVSVPKAEIPTQAAKPSEPLTTTAASETPITEEELNVYRGKFTALGNDLAAAGLKASKGLPINRKIKAYLLTSTGVAAVENITRIQWTTFFAATDAAKASEAGIKSLIPIVNERAGVK